VIRVEIAVPNYGLTFEVARGTVLALHLHTIGGTPDSSWENGSYVGPDQDFAASLVPFPGGHPKASPTEYYVAYTFPAVGTTHIVIGVPAVCAYGAKCAAPSETITVRSVAPPLATATVTGELTRQCGPGCLVPAVDATITFRDQTGRSVGGTRTDTNGDYVAELPPGSWDVSTAPTAIHVQQPSLTVVPGDIIIDDVEVNPPGPSSANPNVATKTFELTIHGKVAPGDTFQLYFPAGSQTLFGFCGAPGPVCTSGMTYRHVFGDLISSAPRSYRFEKVTPADQIQVISQGETTFQSSSTIAATVP
jgi:hypothetical protein